jgi:hypothetical protein
MQNRFLRLQPPWTLLFFEAPSVCLKSRAITWRQAMRE